MKNSIINKYKAIPPQRGERFTKKSLTIIGQEITPEEMSRRYAQGFPIPQKVYTEHGIQKFKDLSALDQIDYLRDLERTNRASNQAIRLAEEKLKRQNEIAQQKLQEENIRKQVIEEMRKNSQDKAGMP